MHYIYAYLLPTAVPAGAPTTDPAPNVPGRMAMPKPAASEFLSINFAIYVFLAQMGNIRGTPDIMYFAQG